MTTMPKRFIKRPATIEAMQLTDDPVEWNAVYKWIEDNTLGSFEPLPVIQGLKPYPESGVSIDPLNGRLIISTLEGLHWADEGDWIIRGIQGEFYPCKPDIFESTYQPADEITSDRPDDRLQQVNMTKEDIIEFWYRHYEAGIRELSCAKDQMPQANTARKEMTTEDIIDFWYRELGPSK